MSYATKMEMPIYNGDGKQIKANAIVPSIRVCAFNVGNFANGASGTPAGTDAMHWAFVETFRKCNADVYMFSEWDVNWNGSTTSDSVLGFLKPHHSAYCKNVSGGYTGQMIYSSFDLIDEYYEDFNVVSAYYFIDNVMRINGKDVHFICTHFTWETKAYAESQMQQILDYIEDNDIQYYVIGGDMNLGLHNNDSIDQSLETKKEIIAEEIELLESLGGKSVQGSGWGYRDLDGLFQTAGHYGYRPPDGVPGHLAPYDNIVVSSGINIKNVELIITEASDHDALCVDIEI